MWLTEAKAGTFFLGWATICRALAAVVSLGAQRQKQGRPGWETEKKEKTADLDIVFFLLLDLGWAMLRQTEDVGARW